MGISKDLVAASSTALVLSILKEEESYGYAIIKKVRSLSEEHLEWTDGMLYPVLHKLEEQKLIESNWEQVTAGRRRKYYRLTETGHLELLAQKEQWRIVHSTLMKLWDEMCRIAVDGLSYCFFVTRWEEFNVRYRT